VLPSFVVLCVDLCAFVVKSYLSFGTPVGPPAFTRRT
jgi:hypothetical protein